MVLFFDGDTNDITFGAPKSTACVDAAAQRLSFLGLCAFDLDLYGCESNLRELRWGR